MLSDFSSGTIIAMVYEEKVPLTTKIFCLALHNTSEANATPGMVAGADVEYSTTSLGNVASAAH